MAYREIDLPPIKGIKAMLARIQAKITALENSAGGTSDAKSFKAGSVQGNTVSFFTTTDTTITPAFSFDFPEEIFLDQAKTTLVENFAWSAATYPNSVNPNLEGKSVFVLAVKGDKETNPTTKYSFVNLEKLIDIYAASDTSIVISGYDIKVNTDPSSDNALVLTSNGLKVDLSGKIDKVTGATVNGIAIFDSSGGIIDSGRKVATDIEFNEMLDEVFPTISGGGT